MSRKNSKATKTKAKPYGGRNEAFALSQIRHIPKSKNKAKFDRATERRRDRERPSE